MNAIDKNGTKEEFFPRNSPTFESPPKLGPLNLISHRKNPRLGAQRGRIPLKFERTFFGE